MNEIIALRQFFPMYIVLDTIFLLFFTVILLIRKQYLTLIVGILAGILYMVVDYGIFHLLLGTRSISEGYSLFSVLLWMSMSYGFTNFVWIWLWISKSKHLFEYSLLILLWWFCCPLIVQTFSTSVSPIIIQRTTGSYHGYMAILLFIGYLFLILWNIFQSEKKYRITILWLLIIGILVQFGWEFNLLLGGIRSATFVNISDKFQTMVVNSLLETNLGMPYIYFIFIGITKSYTENLQKRKKPLTVFERISEHNSERVTEK